MTFTVRNALVTVILPALLIVGCSAPVKEQEQSGFLQSYSNLEKVDDTGYLYVSPELASYSAFMIDPVAILFSQDPKKPIFSDKELAELSEFVVDELTEALSRDGGYRVVTRPAPGVARFRVGVTTLDPTHGALNVVVLTKLTGLGRGGIATETEVVDALTGKQIAAGVRWGSGSRILSGFSHMGDAKKLIKRWAKTARQHIDEAHGVTS